MSISQLYSITQIEHHIARKLKYNNTWYFCLIDVITLITAEANPDKYLKKIRKQQPVLNKYILQKCPLLMMKSQAGKYRKVRSVNLENIFRIIQSLSSEQSENIKELLASIASEKINKQVSPENKIEEALKIYKQHGKNNNWISKRIQSVGARKSLTDYWIIHDVNQSEFKTLTNELYKQWSGMNSDEYFAFKNLKKGKDNLRDNMNSLELLMTQLAEHSTQQFSEIYQANGLKENQIAVKKAGKVVKKARIEFKKLMGKSMLSKQNLLVY